jgi:hypothetical protein
VLGTVDTIRGAYFQTRHLLLALAAGEPHRICRALLVEAVYAATLGVPGRARTEQLLAQATALAGRLGSPYLNGFARGSSGVAAGLQGRHREAVILCGEGEALFGNVMSDVGWELQTIRFMHAVALAYLGSLRQLEELVERGLRYAETRGDRYGAALLRIGQCTLPALAADEPETVRQDVQRAMRDWSRDGFFLEHWLATFAELQVDLYVGQAQAALERLDARWPELERSYLLRIEATRIDAWHLRARVALAAAQRASGAERAQLIARARRDGRRLRAIGATWALPLVDAIEGAAHALTGAAQPAIDAFAAAETAFETQGMALHAASARRARGILMGSDAGSAVVGAADEILVSAGVRSPERMMALFVPGVAQRGS